MKILYYGEPIPQILVDGEKRATFRVTDGQDITRGDLVSFLLPNGAEFARVACTKTKWTRFKDLTEEDWGDHERFTSTEKMLSTYSNWEQRPIKIEDPVKIIRFRYLSFKQAAVLEYIGRD